MGLPRCALAETWPLDGAVPQGDGAGPDPRAAGDRNARAGWNADGGARAAGGNLWRIGGGQEHADRDDDAQHRGGPDRGGAGGRARARGREFLEDALGEEGRKRSVVLVSTSDRVAAAADARRAGGDIGGGVLCVARASMCCWCWIR